MATKYTYFTDAINKNDNIKIVDYTWYPLRMSYDNRPYVWSNLGVRTENETGILSDLVFSSNVGSRPYINGQIFKNKFIDKYGTYSYYFNPNSSYDVVEYHFFREKPYSSFWFSLSETTDAAKFYGENVDINGDDIINGNIPYFIEYLRKVEQEVFNKLSGIEVNFGAFTQYSLNDSSKNAILYVTVKLKYSLFSTLQLSNNQKINYAISVKNDNDENYQGTAYIDLNSSEFSTEFKDLTDEVYESSTQDLIELTDPIDFWNRTTNLRWMVTHWNDAGVPVANNENYLKYLNPNCYAWTQPVWNKESYAWEKNQSESEIERRGCLWVSGGWFNETSFSEEDPKDGVSVWYPFTILPNGQGHNPKNGYTVGCDVPYFKTAYPNGFPTIGLEKFESITNQSAIGFTNLLNFTENNGHQKKVYAYTNEEDFSTVIVNGKTPTIELSIKGQNISRLNLEMNNILTRW